MQQCSWIELPADINLTVYVSPLCRTIQTACLLLANHPLKAQITLKLDPLLKEHMSYQNTLL